MLRSPYANLYPNDSEELIERLPDLCEAADRLMEPLVKRALQMAETEVVAANAGRSADDYLKSYRDEDPEGLKNRLAACAAGVFTTIKLGFQLEGQVFLAESIVNSFFTDIEIVTRSAGLPNNYTGRLCDATRELTNVGAASFTAGSNLYRLQTYGGSSRKDREYDHDYWISYNTETDKIYEPHGQPIANASAPLSKHQKKILDQHGPYGLVYHDALTQLRFMHRLGAVPIRER